MSRRGVCPECLYSVQLRKDGTIGGHLLYGAGFGGAPKPCDGAGLVPAESRVAALMALRERRIAGDSA